VNVQEGASILNLRLTVGAISGGINGHGKTDERRQVEALPDLASLSDGDLKRLIDELQQEENEVSYRRRILHGKIDILRAELVARLQTSGGRSVLEEVDVDRLTDILTGKATPDG
jgi:hypothetical protein